ncbi:hypothetical protein H6X68_08150 [Actinomyces sp. 186855]|nr:MULTISPECIES: hypothetical protein [unclassified Actinomyces]MCL3792548.1 hypothetical protein [Actinomyces sp. 186855]MCL3794581.1 hypothetical protein [Actinomyces sp. 217892]
MSLATQFGIDEEDPSVWAHSWPWLRRRILAVAIDPDTPLGHALMDG